MTTSTLTPDPVPEEPTPSYDEVAATYKREHRQATRAVPAAMRALAASVAAAALTRPRFSEETR